MKVAALFLLMIPMTALAAELPVRDGLILHFDAAAQAALRQRAGLPFLGRQQPMDLMLDGSSTNSLARAAHQVIPDARPVFVTDGTSAFLRFDGKDDFLSLVNVHPPAEALTVFILAAPLTNGGNFSALFGATLFGRNDYTSGINFDFGPGWTKELSVLNVETAGAMGFRDLLVPGFLNATDRPFADFHVFTVRTKVGKAGTEVFLDGFKGGERERAESDIGLDEIVVGARFYSNDPSQPPHAQGFFNGAIADVLVYNRALSNEERMEVEKELAAKTVALNALLHGARGHALETVKDPPLVQMLVPGFTVHELPLKIGNLTNVRYRHDGKLVGLGYDGRIHLLSDTDGDGLEDKDEFFWDQRTMRAPIGMALTTKDDPRGDGVFVGSKGKVSFFLDADRNGRADEEQIIAGPWPEPIHGVDSVGLAVDPKDGSIYFGRGCANFVEAYLIDRTTGQSKYRLDDERGTVQRISADFSKREIICTGVRFTCALAFNKVGDLFATDQEGATWLANGNPLDELLHIQRGRHYGFPPRHPKHLPDVRDEPAVIEYGPQHQSTVGMVFNDGVNGGPHFGPAHWEGDALICGESRGKLYRTKLAKTPLGYVAQNHLIACLSLLTVDACVSPQGDLIVACHSGPPDWGTGPAGEGRIFKIRYTGRSLPQPVQAWASAPDEFRIAFDRALDPADWATAKSGVKIEGGEHVRPGDRFEVIRPGYQIVRDQMAAPRRWIELLGLSLTEDHRTMVLRVPRNTEPLSYAVTLPVPEAWKQSKGIKQHSQIDLALDLSGVAASVVSGAREVRTVLPHSSLGASAIFTRGSVEHESFFKAAAAEGAVLSLRTAVDVSNPFVPAVQPGARLDWDMDKDPVASKPFTVRGDVAGGPEIRVEGPSTGSGLSTNRFRSVSVAAIKNPASDGNGLFLTDGTIRQVIPTARFRLPWATAISSAGSQSELARVRTDVKGSWMRGRRVYFSDGGCATCHTIREEGTAFGPDLSNLVHRDRESVLQDILQPSAAINPDHTGSLVKFRDRPEQAGLVRSLTAEKLVLGLPAGAQLEAPRAQVASIEPLKTSLMPAGLGEILNAEMLEDLLTFLLINPLEPASITRTDPPMPPARKLDEVFKVFGGPPQSPYNPPPLKIVLCSGPKDHGIDEHDYPLWLDRWSRLLALAENVSVKMSTGFPTSEQLRTADVAVFFNANPAWNAEKAAELDKFHKRGGGALYLHYAVDGGKDPAGVGERMGLSFTLGSKFRHGEFDLVFQQGEHPITRGLPTLHFTDETYWNMRGDVSRLNVLGTSVEEGAPRPELWTLEREKSRIVGCIPGHYTWTFDDPLFRVLVLRAICWTARQENVDRLGELSLIGARWSR
jgi:putative heme-binding domain-containing protein